MLYHKISNKCEEMQISIAELERRAGIKPRTIDHWKNSKPLAENLNAVAKVLNTTVEELLKQ